MSYAPQILIVEDEPAVRKFLDRVLAEDGYFVTAVGTGRQALRTLQDAAFEVIILDMSLPDADGTEVLREIRAEIPHVPVLALSGMMVNSMETAARAAGADATLAKPATAGRLREVLNKLIDSQYRWAAAGNGLTN